MWGVPDTHLSLEEYWEFLQISEPHGYGIRNAPAEVTGWGCGDYWNQDERYWLAAAIAKAEKRMRKPRHLHYPIRREYVGTEYYEYQWPLTLRNSYVRGMGVEVTTVFGAGTALTLSTGGVIHDPVEFTITVDFSDEDELILYYPGQTRYTIRPSSVSISGTTATVQIARSRLLRAAYFINYRDNVIGYQDVDRPDYETDANFYATVDVARNYLNTQTGNNLVWQRLEPAASCMPVSWASCEPTTPCGETLQLACGYVKDQRLGIVQLEPATYSGGWVKAAYTVNRRPDGLQVNYMAGRWDRYDEIDEDMIRAIIAVAHNNLPRDYCKCAIQERYYKRDTEQLQPTARLALGPSTWGIYEAGEIVHENKIVEGVFV
jgi:hypothetical protein